MLNDRPLRTVKLTDELDHILQDCIKGKRTAQGHLYKMYSAKMFGVCLRYCRNYEEAKDILQEGFIKIFDKIHQYGRRGCFEGWVRRIMINTALEKYRKNSQTIVLEQVPENYEEEDNEIDFDITLKEILWLIQKLPERYRMVFNLYVFEEMSHKEIAETLGITEGTSKSDLSRARGILQNKINIRTKQRVKIG
jgi:RNA polymerase sigma-70 factor (ECF subfamily)